MQHIISSFCILAAIIQHDLQSEIHKPLLNQLFFIFRGVYTAAENYPSHAEKSSMTLVEAFRNLQVEEEESFENGDIDHEVTLFLFQ